jgi:hypothetical protein
MEFLEGNHPPHITQVSLQELRAWESGQMSLSPDQLVAARYLQDMLANQRQIIEGEVVACSDVLASPMPVQYMLGAQVMGLVNA